MGGDDDGSAPWAVVARRRGQDNVQPPVQNWIVDPLAGGVVSSAVAVKRISEGLPLQATLVVAHAQAEVDKLVSLARAHGITDKVAVVCRFTPEGKAGTMQLPSVGPGGKRQVRSWPVVPLGDAGGPALQQKLVLKPSTFKVPERSLETIRLQIPKAFLDDATWAVACKQPSDFAKRALGSVHSFGVWQQVQAGARDKREIVLECCARVSSDGKAAILGRSGYSGVFAADLANAGPKPQVEWITCGETVGPAYLRLAGNKAAEKKSSLAFRRGGGAALGVRLLGTDSPARVCAWRARHIPRSWTPDEVVAALQDVGFTEYNLLSPGHGQLPWLFRAKLTDDTGQSALAIQFGKVTDDIERAAAKRRMVDVEAVRVRPTREQKASSPPSLSAAPSVPTTATGPATTPAPMAVDGQIPQRGRPHSSEKSARDRSRSNRSKAEPWFEVIDCGGAGNCYFNCVGASYAVSKDAQRLANTRGCALRAELASYIREKAAAFKPFWLFSEEPQTEAERLNLKQAEGGEPLYTWEAYLAGLDRPKRWVDDIAIWATAKRLNCRVIVVVGSVDKPSQIISFGKKIDWEDRPQVVIPLLYSDKHCQLIVPKQGHSLPQAWMELEPGSTISVVPRGGGKPLPCGSSTSSRRSPKCWLPLRAPSMASSRALELHRTLGCRRGLLLRLLRLLVGAGLWGDGFLLGLLPWLLRALGLQRTLGCRRGPLPRKL